MVILASGSPRRKKLLGFLGVSFRVMRSDFQEPAQLNLTPLSYVRQMAKLKTQEAARRCPQEMILAADTVVVDGDRVIGKPRNSQEARKILKNLRGKWHRVITAIALKSPGRPVRIKHTFSRVLMRSFDDHWILSYVKSGRPMDKAGAYGIQDHPWKPVARYEGCWCNIVGLPLMSVIKILGRKEFIGKTKDIDCPQICRRCPDR